MLRLDTFGFLEGTANKVLFISRSIQRVIHQLGFRSLSEELAVVLKITSTICLLVKTYASV